MDTFYNIRELTIEQKVALLNDCKAVCFEWWVDKLDCSVSFSRQKIEMSYEEIMQKLDDHIHVVVIDRKESLCDEPKHFEVGFRTMATAIDYFLWLWVEDKNMFPIIEKHGLQPVRR